MAIFDFGSLNLNSWLGLQINGLIMSNVVEPDFAYVFPVSGKLVSNGQPVSNKPVLVKVNGTAIAAVNTTSDDSYSLKLKLKPVNNTVTNYKIDAVFQSDIGANATLMGLTPNGTQYALCTTLHYGFKPSSNSTVLTVEPQGTGATTQTKTQGQMQQEAEQSGWLSFWHEFGETWSWEGLELFADVVAEIWEEVMLDFMGVFISYAIAKGLSIWNLLAGFIAEGIKGAVQYVLFFSDFSKESAGSLKMLAAGIANILMGLIAIGTNVGEAFIKTLQNIIFGPAISAIMLITTKMVSLAAPLRVFRTAVDYIECGVDFSIAIFALLRYLRRI